MKDNPVYWDSKRQEFYLIEWEETGNSDIPHRKYLDIKLTREVKEIKKAKKKSCNDCVYHFTNPFDEDFCRTGRKGTVVCKEYTGE